MIVSEQREDERNERDGRVHQVDGEVDEGKGDAGDAVEPKAESGRQVSPRHDPYVVVVLEFVGVKSDKELYKNLYLRPAQSARLCAVASLE